MFMSLHSHAWGGTPLVIPEPRSGTHFPLSPPPLDDEIDLAPRRSRSEAFHCAMGLHCGSPLC
jgi:hypothetical protein